MTKSRFVLLIWLIFIVAHGSDASLFQNFRKLVESKPKVTAPSASPVPSLKPNNTESNNPVASPKDESAGKLTDERCKMSLDPFSTCHDHGNLTACLLFSAQDPGELILLVQNDGETSLQIHGDILPKISFKEIQLHKQQAKKLNFTAYFGKSISIALTAGNGSCTIRKGVPNSQGNFYQLFPSSISQVTPVHGAYLMSLTILIIGGTWACCKWGGSGHRVDDIPYQELEMGQQTGSVSANNVETAEGWDDSWDNDWGNEESVNTNHVENGSVNGLNPRPSKKDEWGNDWDD